MEAAPSLARETHYVPYRGQSANGMRWRLRAATPGEDRRRLLEPVLARRGIVGKDRDIYLAPTLGRDLPSPFVLADMKPAAVRIAKAIKRRERVVVYGDYDVDGATSTALLLRWLGAQGVNVGRYIPDRMTEGYGPNTPAMEKLAAAGTDLVVCVDSGIAALDPLGRAAELGMDVVVLDHHAPLDVLPRAVAVVNPNRRDDTSGLGYMCAAGVTFMAIVATQQILQAAKWDRPIPDPRDLLDIVALGTVCDVVPLVGANRALVTAGLQRMGRMDAGEMKVSKVGIHAMALLADREPPFDAWHCGFVFGPRINAAGRIDTCSLGADLLATDDEELAVEIATKLEGLNAERKAMCEETEAQAAEMVERACPDGDYPPVLVVHDNNWHPGIVGIVAGRIRERFDRPTFIIGSGGKGSGRSVPGYDMGAVVIEATKPEVGLLAKGGGHPMAAGLTARLDRLDEFARFCRQRGRGLGPSWVDIDIEVDPRDLRVEAVRALAAMEPCGQANPEAVVATVACRCRWAGPTADGRHVRIIVEGPRGGEIHGIAFNAGGKPLGDAMIAAEGRLVHLLGHLGVNEWQGRTMAQIRVRDLMVANQDLGLTATDIPY